MTNSKPDSSPSERTISLTSAGDKSPPSLPRGDVGHGDIGVKPTRSSLEGVLCQPSGTNNVLVAHLYRRFARSLLGHITRRTMTAKDAERGVLQALGVGSACWNNCNPGIRRGWDRTG